MRAADCLDMPFARKSSYIFGFLIEAYFLPGITRPPRPKARHRPRPTGSDRRGPSPGSSSHLRSVRRSPAVPTPARTPTRLSGRHRQAARLPYAARTSHSLHNADESDHLVVLV